MMQRRINRKRLTIFPSASYDIPTLGKSHLIEAVPGTPEMEHE
jgi:hypothetical protein